MDYSLDILLGGKVQWCWVYEKQWHQRMNSRFGVVWCESYPTYHRVWSLTLIYFKVKSIQQLKAQVSHLKVPFPHSGFILPGRGLHWHRAPQLRRN